MQLFCIKITGVSDRVFVPRNGWNGLECWKIKKSRNFSFIASLIQTTKTMACSKN